MLNSVNITKTVFICTLLQYYFYYKILIITPLCIYVYRKTHSLFTPVDRLKGCSGNYLGDGPISFDSDGMEILSEVSYDDNFAEYDYNSISGEFIDLDDYDYDSDDMKHLSSLNNAANRDDIDFFDSANRRYNYFSELSTSDARKTADDADVFVNSTDYINEYHSYDTVGRLIQTASQIHDDAFITQPRKRQYDMYTHYNVNLPGSESSLSGSDNISFVTPQKKTKVYTPEQKKVKIDKQRIRRQNQTPEAAEHRRNQARVRNQNDRLAESPRNRSLLTQARNHRLLIAPEHVQDHINGTFYYLFSYILNINIVLLYY